MEEDWAWSFHESTLEIREELGWSSKICQNKNITPSSKSCTENAYTFDKGRKKANLNGWFWTNGWLLQS